MAVLQHVHYDSDWVLPEIARITRDILITIEDEGRSLGRHFPRNYKNIFEAQGLRQIKAINCAGVVGLGHTYTARVYRVRD
jgi:hypothetical protein